MNSNKFKKYSLLGVGLLLVGSVTFSCNKNNGGNITSNAIVSSTNSNYTKNVIDGDLSTSWEQEGVPAILELDLGEVYKINSIKVYGYGDGTNYQKYKILYSTNNINYHLYSTKESSIDTVGGEEYNKSFTARYIRLDIFEASIPTKKRMGFAHIREVELYGSKGGAIEKIPEIDPNDPNNLAYLKKVSTNMPFMSTNGVTAGDQYNYFRSKFCPMYVDIDLGEDININEIIVRFPEVNNYYYYTIYGSNNGDAFKEIQKVNSSAVQNDIDLNKSNSRKYRYLRIYLQYQDHNNTVGLSNITVHGTKTGENNKPLRDGDITDITGLEAYSETEYAKEIPASETLDNITELVIRISGSNITNQWLNYKLDSTCVSEKGLDQFKITYESGKPTITGNNGLMILSGIKYFWEKYCGGCITEQTASFNFPNVCPTVEEETRINYAKNRYAFNYCTLDYSFAFFSDKEWQRELDYLALNGVNIVLDLAGQEAVWIKFLQNFGYNYDAAKAWLCGPSYYAWQFMQNMDVFGGCVTDGWVKDRLEYARKSQRWRNSLGMETCLQGFAGMIPNDFSNYQSNTKILEQGSWNGFDRPDMLRTDSPEYAQYAKKFYDAQKWAFGDRNHHYAVDPFHEGGIRPDDLSDDQISSSVIKSLYESDKDAVWVIQAWHANPTCGLLDGIQNFFKQIPEEDYKDHVLILDLATVSAADLKFSTEQCSKKWDLKEYFHQDDHGRQETHLHNYEFNKTPWCLCMLENFGGNPSMDGHLRLMVERFAEVYQKPLDEDGTKAECYAGIGLLNEATLDNPIIYNFLFDLAWVKPNDLPKYNKGEDSKDPADWDADAAAKELAFADEYVTDYITRRYGLSEENDTKIVDAWKDLVDKSIYSDITKRTAPFVMTMTPDLIPGKKVFEDAEELKVSNATLEQSLKTLLCFDETGNSINESEFNKLAEMPGYRYDVVEMMRQVVSNTAVYRYKNIYDATENPMEGQSIEERLNIINQTWDDESSGYKVLFSLMDKVLSLNETWLATKWIGRAEDWGKRISQEGMEQGYCQNDFAIDSLMDSAKMLIVGWGHFGAAIHLNDYGERTYQGMLSDLYVNRWQNYINEDIEYVKNGTPIKKDGKGGDYWYCREWMLNVDIHEVNKYVEIAKDNAADILLAAKEVLQKGLNFNNK